MGRPLSTHGITFGILRISARSRLCARPAPRATSPGPRRSFSLLSGRQAGARSRATWTSSPRALRVAGSFDWATQVRLSPGKPDSSRHNQDNHCQCIKTRLRIWATSADERFGRLPRKPARSLYHGTLDKISRSPRVIPSYMGMNTVRACNLCEPSYLLCAAAGGS